MHIKGVEPLAFGLLASSLHIRPMLYRIARSNALS